MTRNIDAPGIQLNEIDRSQYNNTVDYSLPNSPNVLIGGFADSGEDYTAKWINTKNTLIEQYGQPTNEAERYFYNACVEVLNRGGICIAAKLPYDNNSKDHYSYTSYQVANDVIQLKSPYEIMNSDISSSAIDMSLFRFMLMPDIDVVSLNKLLSETQSPITLENSVKTQFRNFFNIDGVNLTSTNNILDIYNRNNIILVSITDLFDYMLSKCSIMPEDTTALKTFFYRADNADFALNDACYRLQYLYDNTVNDFMIKYGQQHQDMTTNVQSIKNSIMNVYEFSDFNKLLTSFGKSNTIEHYKKRYVDLYELQLSNATDNYFIHQIYNTFVQTQLLNSEYTDIKRIDDSIQKLRIISSLSANIGNSGLLSFEQYDNLKTSVSKPSTNKFIIVDKTRQKYGITDLLSGDEVIRDNDCLGILPVVTTAANALLAQGIIGKTQLTLDQYSALADIQRAFSLSNDQIEIQEQNYDVILKSDDVNVTTMSDSAAQLFPTISYDTANVLNRDNLKKVGILVYKMQKAPGSYNKIQLSLVESFIGSFDKKAEDPITHATQFIDTIVNNGSQFISIFSNVNITNDADIYNIRQQVATSLGFYKSDLKKDISLTGSILTPLNRIFDACKDPNQVPVDIVLDAGISNIAQFLKSVYWKEGKGEYDLTSDVSYLFNLNSNDNSSTWKQVITKYDDFCKKTRKDCMFIADGLRTFCLQGNEKLVRNGNFKNTFDNAILPKLKYMIGLNSSYSAGYCDWHKIYDDYSGDAFWCPPSIKAAGVYIYSDVYWHKWDAPAGINRGTLNTVDIAFNPTNEEAGKLYSQAWNYAVSYPISGIVQEGQKTFQRRATAFDRINVRRLFLYLEKQVTSVAKYFLYEGNNAFMRQKFVDTIRPIFEDAVNGNGIAEYVIKCDDQNNTPTTIDRNELHCTIGVRPVKSIEFIVLNFICTSQSASVTEEVQNIA